MKDLVFLLVTSLAICSVVALYTHLAGFSRRAHLASEEAARDLLQKFNPGKTITNLKVAEDQRTALAAFENGDGCLLHTMGRNWVAHALTGQSIRRAILSKSGNLRLTFDDYTAPGIRIPLGGEVEGKAWQAALQPFLKISKTLAEQAA